MHSMNFNDKDLAQNNAVSNDYREHLVNHTVMGK